MHYYINELMPIFAFTSLVLWGRIVIQRGSETVFYIKEITKNPKYIEYYNSCKKLCEKFNGPGSWKRTINSSENKFKKHLFFNTFSYAVLLIWAILLPVFDFFGANISVIFYLYCFCFFCYLFHIGYIEKYNKINKKDYDLMIKSGGDITFPIER